MTTGKLVGRDDVALDTANTPNYIVMSKFTAVATGNVTEIRFRVAAGAAGNVTIGIYADSSGSPAALLGQKAVAVSSGSERVITVILDSAIAVANGTVYWIAFKSDAFLVGAKSEATVRKYKSYAYASLPNPAGIGYTNDTTYSDITSGWGILVISPSSISQPIAYGTPKLIFTIKPSSLVQQVAYGTPTVLTSALIIQPSSFVQSIVIGTPALRYPQTISPPSIIITIAYGTPWVGIFGFIKPQSTIQPVIVGTPILLKYIWHVVLDGQYNIESPEVNRAYVIGQDAYGNPVYGTADNATEGALVGERLDFQQELAIPLTAQAADVAAAILSKMRITGKKGVILIPPNCGQELFDVVQITDSGANQSAVKFRVVGLRFEYNPKQARYRHKLILGAP